MSIIKRKKEVTNENIILESPFYGVRGSIQKVVQVKDQPTILVTRYGENGKSAEVLPTPKKYLKGILKNCMDDIKTYLAVNHDKYLTHLHLQSKVPYSKKKILISTITSLTLSILSAVGFILTSGTTFYLFLAAFICTIITSSEELLQLKKCLEEEKRQKFIHHYKKYVSIVNEYNIKNDKENKNHPIRNEKVLPYDKDKIIDINKTRILKNK